MMNLDLTPWRVKKIADADDDSFAYLVPDADLKADGSKMAVRVIVSTETMDHARDVMLVKGCDFTTHRDNPIVLLTHKKKWPGVAQARDPDGNYTVKALDGKIEATHYFNQKTKLGLQGFRLVESGALRGVSPGFYTRLDEVQKFKAKDGGPVYVHNNWKLLEISHVPIPENPEALVLAVEKGFGGEQLAPELKDLLLPYVPERKPQVTSGWDKSLSNDDLLDMAKTHRPDQSWFDEHETIDLSDAAAVPLTPSTQFYHAVLHKAMDTLGMVQELRGIQESPRTKSDGGYIIGLLNRVMEVCKSGHAGHVADYPDQPGLPGEFGDDIAKKDMEAWRTKAVEAWEKWKADLSVAVATECVGGIKETVDFLRVVAGDPKLGTSLRASARNYARKLERVKMVSAPSEDDEAEAWGQVALKLDAWSKPVEAVA